ncbi:hypothetical protein [Candidatus Halobonum tyrrellensis]|uniref:Uncharacterized protein n=1 Tax=Candidatus Halobonum tyrrellensis G22 TaxID=1324957 RepID=V4J042_9EURY|nr:hypothetical protein [Candidatus Halobonum tyrrellensis]ESP88792.1 hypothetical protein K933_07346 [Candidatus Halobonum tyrrellensis G22]
MSVDGDPTALRAALEDALDTAADADARYYLRTALQLYDARRDAAATPARAGNAEGTNGPEGA